MMMMMMMILVMMVPIELMIGLMTITLIKMMVGLAVEDLPNTTRDGKIWRARCSYANSGRIDEGTWPTKMMMNMMVMMIALKTIIMTMLIIYSFFTCNKVFLLTNSTNTDTD